MRHPHDKAESRFNTDTGISKEDEERYKKLVTENEELQKLIAQVRMTNDAFIRNSVSINFNFSSSFSVAVAFIERRQNSNIETTISRTWSTEKWHTIRLATTTVAIKRNESIRNQSRWVWWHTDHSSRANNHIRLRQCIWKWFLYFRLYALFRRWVFRKLFVKLLTTLRKFCFSLVDKQKKTSFHTWFSLKFVQKNDLLQGFLLSFLFEFKFLEIIICESKTG